MQTWAEIGYQADNLCGMLREASKAIERDVEKNPRLERIRIDMEREIKQFIIIHEEILLQALEYFHKDQFVEANDPTHLFDRAFEEVAKKAVPKLAAIIFKYTRRAYSLGQDEEIELQKGRTFEEASRAQDMGIALNLRSEMAEGIIRNKALDQATATVTKTFKERIARNVLDQAVREGWGYSKTAKEIKALHTYFRHGEPQKHIRSHAHLIAIAESRIAYSEGHKDTVEEIKSVLGIQMEKTWHTAGDDRVSEGCEENESAGWIPDNEAFPSGHNTTPRHPACRCYVDYRPI